jgi:N-acyl-D-amino-acid deacylase
MTTSPDSRSLLIRNACIIDGTGSPAVGGDVAVQDGKIVATGKELKELATTGLPAGTREIDAKGLVVAPGFIDVHTHFDPQLCWDRLASPMLEHGVTTVLMGNCSLSLAPVKKADQRALAGMFKQIEDIQLSAFAEGVSWDWESFPEYLDGLRPGLGLNVASLVGHSALRLYVMGEAAQQRAATEQEIAQMSTLLGDAIRAGAAGLSTSYVDIDEHLRPVPSRFAEKEEIIALGRAMTAAGRGVIETVPVFYNPPEQLKNIEDMGEISRATGAMCTIAPIVHGFGSTLWEDSLKALAEQAEQGAKIYGQSMPRTFDLNVRLSETSFLFFSLPAWFSLMRQALPERLAGFADPAQRAELCNQAKLLGGLLSQMEVGQTKKADNAHLTGRKLADLAVERGVELVDVMLDLAVEEDLETEFCLKNFIHADTDGVTKILSHPSILIGASDAGAHVAQFCGAGDTGYLLARWVRELKSFSLEQAVYRLTGQLADAFGIRGRGRLVAGQAADLVMFNPDTIDRGAEEFVNDVPGGGNRYIRHATGIEMVVVNGAVVREQDVYTDARAGEIV